MVKIQDATKGMLLFSDYLLKNSSDALVITPNANPQECDHLKLEEISANFAWGIHSARIETIDSESQTYTGKISWSDYIEGCNPISSFIAHPIPEEVNFNNGKNLVARTIGRNCLTEGYHFTLLPDMNKAMKGYINRAIKKPINLPLTL